jgi:hypothetical protein
VRAGTLGAHVARKCLVPLARANRADGERLADAVAPLRLTTPQMAIVHAAWLGAISEWRRPRHAGDRDLARRVKEVLAACTADVPEIARAEKAKPYREQLLELVPRFKNNLVRVHEELVAASAKLSTYG